VVGELVKAEAAEVGAEFERLEDVAADPGGEEFRDDGGADRGQRVKMPENRLRILVACGAAGGISATFNAPITGVFFGVEIILREFSIDALFTVLLAR
jgi:hypothetical protein